MIKTEIKTIMILFWPKRTYNNYIITVIKSIGLQISPFHTYLQKIKKANANKLI